MTTTARKERLKKARIWWKEQKFTEQSHIVKAYRKKFGVDKVCAMRELVMLNVLGPERQESYKRELAAKDRKRAAKRERMKYNQMVKELGYDPEYQDENFVFIAGYTSGGVPYGVTWEEVADQNVSDWEKTDRGTFAGPTGSLPF